MAYQNPFFNSHFYNEFNSHVNPPPPPPPTGLPTADKDSSSSGDRITPTAYIQQTSAYMTPAAVPFLPNTPVVPVMTAFPMQNGFHHQQQFAHNNNHNGFRGAGRGMPRFNNAYKRKSNNNNQYQGKRTKKEENFIAFCDVCDRGFKTQEKKDEHYREHKKCDHPGCKFEAHFKIVAMHYKNMHGPNSFNIRVSTPEEIQKWREERKKNYPTHGRVQEKNKLEKENIARGAVLKQQSFGKFNKNKNQNRHNRNNKKNQKFNTYRTERTIKEEPVGNENTSTPNNNENENGMSIDTVGIPAIKAEHGTSVKSAEKKPPSAPNPDEIKNVVKDVGALKSLMFCYSDSESDNEQNDVVKDGNTSNATRQEPNTYTGNHLTNESHNDNSEKTEPVQEETEVCPEPVKQKQFNGNRNQNKNNRRNQKQQRNKLPTKRPSLLRKLLEPEIRKERNDILQCIRYIVENNFFDDLPPPTTK